MFAAGGVSALAGCPSGDDGTKRSPTATRSPTSEPASATPESPTRDWTVAKTVSRTRRETGTNVTFESGRVVVTGTVVPSDCFADIVLESARVDTRGQFRVEIGEKNNYGDIQGDCSAIPTYEYELTFDFEAERPATVVVTYASGVTNVGEETDGSEAVVVSATPR